MSFAQLPLRILLTGIDAQQLAELQAIMPDANLSLYARQADLEMAIEDADVVAGLVSRDAFARARRLKWVHSWAAGPDAQLFAEFVDSPVVLTCSKGNGAVPLAEHAMMLMLMLNRNAMRWIEAHRSHKWEPSFTANSTARRSALSARAIPGRTSRSRDCSTT
jgi:phosphoglycerate dehydrogenase-like enzyme